MADRPGQSVETTKARAAPGRDLLAQEKRKYEQVCRQNPGNFQAWWNLGRINLELGHPQHALPAFDRALTLKPNHLDLLIGKIIACNQLSRFSDALATAEQAEGIAPTNSDVLLHKAHILHRLEKRREALRVYERLSGLPDLSKQKQLYVVSARIALLVDLHRYEEALAAVDAGLALAPESPAFLLNKATVLIWLRQYETALDVIDKLAALAKLDFAALGNKAQALASSRRFDEAEAVLGELRERYPQELRVQEFGISAQWIPADAVAMGHAPQSLYFNGLLDALSDCDWAVYQETLAELDRLTIQAQEQGNIPRLEPFRLFSLPSEPTLRLALARARAEHIERSLAPIRDGLQITHPTRAPGERLRIGYVSGDFRDHPTAHLIRKLFKVHDRSCFEIIGYSLQPGDGSPYWQDISSSCDRFVDLTRSTNAEAARRIAQDGVHILIDLHGYTQCARPEIFALRPAPVQVSYLGYPGTMGADFIHYLIADRVILPEEHQCHYTEQPVYLPDCYQVNDNTQTIAETGVTRAAQGLPEGAFVYCCFNASHKIEPFTFDAWMEILRQVPDSVLWLLEKNERVTHNLRGEAQRRGIAPDRLIFARRLPRTEHLERHRLADLFLDTFIYNAHTTASDALWAGLPVLTLRGETFPARVCASLLLAVGLSEQIAYNKEHFVRLAVGLAGDSAKLEELKAKLITNRLSLPLFDTEQFTRHLERAFEIMWEVNAAGISPYPLSIERVE